MTPKSISVLLIEDNPVDALLIKEILNNVREPEAIYKLTHVDRLDRGIEILRKEHIDAILLDLSLPDSQGYDTFMAVQKAAASLPIIICSIMNDEALAIRAVHNGAQDYLLKGHVHHILLVRSIRYAIERKEMEREREKLINNLKEALSHVRILTGLLPICASCKKVRDDKGYWHKVERYVADHTDIGLIHGICPDCMGKLKSGIVPTGNE